MSVVIVLNRAHVEAPNFLEKSVIRSRWSNLRRPAVVFVALAVAACAVDGLQKPTEKPKAAGLWDLSTYVVISEGGERVEQWQGQIRIEDTEPANLVPIFLDAENTKVAGYELRWEGGTTGYDIRAGQNNPDLGRLLIRPDASTVVAVDVNQDQVADWVTVKTFASTEIIQLGSQRAMLKFGLMDFTGINGT